MRDRSPEISLIITGHREGRYLAPALRSGLAAKQFAEQQGATVEIIVVLDRSDARTHQIAFELSSSLEKILELDVGDPGLSRNLGIQASLGTWIALLDGDDLISQNWLAAAWQTARESGEVNSSRATIFHPEYHLTFGQQFVLHRSPDWPNSKYQELDFLESNLWPVSMFCRRSVFESGRWFQPIDFTNGFGHEDWHWYCEGLAAGDKHRAVAETIYFIRAKSEGSMLQQAHRTRAIIRPTRLFEFDRVQKTAPPPAKTEKTSFAMPNVLDLPIPWSKSKLTPRLAMRKLLGEEGRRYYPKTARAATSLLELASVFRDVFSPVSSVPPAIVEGWKAQHGIDPTIFPRADEVSKLVTYAPPTSLMRGPYREMAQRFSLATDYLFILPWLKHGGADLVAMHHVRALQQAVPGIHITCLLTENVQNPWLERLPSGICVVEAGPILAALPVDHRALLLARLLLQAPAKNIHVMNSDLGYRLLSQYGRQLKTQSRLMASVYCTDRLADGEQVSYAVTDLPNCEAYLDFVFSDNTSFLKQLGEWYGIPPEKRHTLSYPIAELPAAPKPKQPANALSILWAGRLTRQKRPDVLLQIARHPHMAKHQFHIYGESDNSDATETVVTQLKQLNNVKLYGRYEAFSQLTTERFHVLLYTTQWDGLPNVLIEALAHGLPVVAPDVGGIAEIIDDQVGYLVPNLDSPQQFVEALQSVERDFESSQQKGFAGYERIVRTRTMDAFIKRLRAIPGYL